MNKLIIIGASGHGKVIADIASLNGYREIYFLDDDETIGSVGEYSVIGTTNKAFDFSLKEYDFVVGIGNAEIRRDFQTRLETQGYNLVSLIHPSAIIADGVKIGNGTVIMAGAIINSGSAIGRGCIINSSSSIDHDNEVGDFVHISVAAHTAGTVKIGENTWIGIGAIISNNIIITDNVTIGAGAVVVKDINSKGVYVGVPAKLRG